MTKTTLAIVLVTVARVAAAATSDNAAIATGTDVGQRLPPFTAPLIDLTGGKPKTADFDSAKLKHPTVYIFVGTHCPTTAAYTERLAQLEKAYKPKGVDFIYIYPNREDTPDAKLAFHGEKKLTGRVIDDQGARLARLFNAKRTTEIFLVNKDGVIVFHGGVDDSKDAGGVKERYLATAIDQVLAGKPVTTATSQVFA